ncbi:hypothetical protein BLNAU_3310 [Blattamonas nauphoetae]|uniref:Uncharacterized protein n=1 Tax=Blattamonas nauphoetae TaxID=2049346 RepID=A0ABQ9YDN5_9EUKA|nr:hypothetical protein BLNAU_3310 [Blattamonas nauphoetae]
MNKPTMASSDEYTPFLTWKETDPLTVDSVRHYFLSLVTMVRDGYHFDAMLLQKTALFLSSMSSTVNRTVRIDLFVEEIGQGSPNPAAVLRYSGVLLHSSTVVSTRGIRIHPSIDRQTHVLPHPQMEERWSRNLAQRETIVADTGTGRVS